MKKRKILIPLLILLICGGGAGTWYYKTHVEGQSADEDAIFVDSVASIMGLTTIEGSMNRFAGVVEPQKTESIQLASGMKVKETYVSVGDEVKVGTKLFSYDTEDAQDNITQLEIDIENEDISIESAQNQVKELTKERDKAKESDKLSYTTQIMTTENSIKRYEYEKKSKQAEMESLKKQIANSVVYSDFQGVVKSVNSSMASDSDSGLGSLGSDDSNTGYMQIMATGDYRIKGSVNEQHMSQIREGTDVLVYSRVDETQYWRGTISSIDKEHASSNSNNNYYMGTEDSMTSSSTYPFYITLESSEGLMLGQHVFVVVDEGQEDGADGMWLEDYYFITDENGAVTNYVWVADSNDKLEKRELKVGKYDEELMKYEILDGLTEDDYIAFPMEEYTEGMKVTKNTDVQYDYSDEDSEYDYGTDDEEVIEDDEEVIEDDEEVIEDDEEVIEDDEEVIEDDGEVIDDEDVTDEDLDDGTLREFGEKDYEAIEDEDIEDEEDDNSNASGENSIFKLKK